MFDIGFFEILIIAVVGLLVIGPERLPQTLRDIALMVGRIKRGMRDTRLELERQLGTDDIRRQLHNEEVLRKLEDTRRELNMTLTEDTFANPSEQNTLLPNDAATTKPSATTNPSHKPENKAASGSENHLPASNTEATKSQP